MFDTNAFDKMYTTDDDLDRIVASNKYEYYITSIQIEEIGNIPDSRKEQRKQNLMTLCKIGAQLLFVPAVVGHARLDCCVVADENDVYSDLLKVTHSNVNDAMIGSTAKRENCIVVTDDKDFSKRLKKHSVPTMTYNEFIQSL